jgi:DNA-binding response OmpR family regulator
MTAPPTELGGMRILVVDDNQDGAELLAEALAERGAEVRIALDGRTALTTAREFVPSAVFLDLGLPDINGYQVADEMRLEPALTGTRIVALTGYGNISDRERTRAAGFDGHVVKPFEMGELLALLDGCPPSR